MAYIPITQPNAQARIMLEITTLNRVLKPCATLEEAFAGFGSYREA